MPHNRLELKILAGIAIFESEQLQLIFRSNEIYVPPLLHSIATSQNGLRALVSVWGKNRPPLPLLVSSWGPENLAQNPLADSAQGSLSLILDFGM